MKNGAKRLPKAKRIIITGNPIKISAQEDSIKRGLVYSKLTNKLELNNKLPIVLVFGGSQGAKSINKALINIIKNNINNNYQLIWAARTKTI